MEQTFNAGVHGGVAGRDSYSFPEATHVQVINHFHAPAPAPRPQALPRLGRVKQRELLVELVAMGARVDAVFDFMERKFATRVVHELAPDQVCQTRSYAEAVRKHAAASRTRQQQEQQQQPMQQYFEFL